MQGYSFDPNDYYCSCHTHFDCSCHTHYYSYQTQNDYVRCQPRCQSYQPKEHCHCHRSHRDSYERCSCKNKGKGGDRVGYPEKKRPCDQEKCDCCCVPGIRERLVENSTVLIFIPGFAIVGRVLDVDCDTVVLGPVEGELPITPIEGLESLPVVRGMVRFSLCEISGVFPA